MPGLHRIDQRKADEREQHQPSYPTLGYRSQYAGNGFHFSLLVIVCLLLSVMRMVLNMRMLLRNVDGPPILFGNSREYFFGSGDHSEHLIKHGRHEFFVHEAMQQLYETVVITIGVNEHDGLR